MPDFSDNLLRSVVTYQQYCTARVENMFATIKMANKRFENFNNLTAQLGDTVSFPKPYRFRASDSLVLDVQAVEQRIMYLTVDKSASIAREFDDLQFIFNVDQPDRLKQMTDSAISEIGAKVEYDVASAFINDTYRFYGNGVDFIDTFGKLAKALEFFNEYGAAKTDVVGFLPNVGVEKIVSSGLQEFVPVDNEDLRRKWMIGDYQNCKWTKSNLLNKHIAGTVGQSLATVSPILLTVVSTVKDVNGYITNITFSGAPISDPNAVKKGDLFQFSNIAGETDHSFDFLTFNGHQPSSAPVQFGASADAASDGAGNVTVALNNPLVPVDNDRNQNITEDVTAGMTCWVANSHIAACINAGSTLFLAMPKLVSTEPFASSNEINSDTGISIRAYFGTILQTGRVPVKVYANDCIWAKKMDGDNSLRMCFPLNS